MKQAPGRRGVLDQQVKYAGMLWLLAAQAAVMLPFMLTLPVWLMLVLLFCTTWRLRVLRGHWRQPGRWLKGGLLALAVLALATSNMNPLSLDAAASLLLLGFALKALEVAHRRDALVVIFSGYFLVAVQFLYNQSIGAAAYGVACLALLTAALIAVESYSTGRVSGHLKLAALMLVQCLPLMVITYLFFPRISPLWSVSLPSERAVSGVTDRMAPGDIASLAQSDAIAFRVRFAGERPAQNDLYWRGLVLNAFDGRTWTQFPREYSIAELKHLLGVGQSRPALDAKGLEYEAIYEATQQNWLFTLSEVIAWQGRAIEGIDYRLMAGQPLSGPSAYTLVSDIDKPRDRIDPRQRSLALAMPAGQNPRARAMARQWRREARDDRDYADRVMAWFREQPFYYTLRPPLTGPRDTIDRFLFVTRRGFCAHYAGSFVFMLRAAGIPARVVVGYQGGEWNREGDFLTVHQYDAHAWAEAWLDGRGWVRFDPTAAVAPARVEQNLQTAVRAEGSFLEGKVFSAARVAWLTRLRQRWDALEYGWRRWVLDYDHEKQTQWLQQWLGKISVERVALVFGVLFALVILAWLVMLGYLRRSDKLPAEQKIYRRFLGRMEKRGLARPPGLTPSQFAELAADQFPESGRSILEATRVYEYLSYGLPSPAVRDTLLRRFGKLVGEI